MNHRCESGSNLSRRAVLLGGAAAALLGVPAYASAAAAANDTRRSRCIPVQLLSITDLHGNLRPPGNGDGLLPDDQGRRTVRVGGAAYIAAHAKRLKSPANSIFFSIGDNISGGEPMDNKMLSDEGPAEVLNKLGLKFSTLGNHELDYGADYFLDHMVKGKPAGVAGRDSSFTDSTGHRYAGLKLPYYSANIVRRDTGRTILPPYNIEQVSGPDGRSYPIGFIHLTLPHTPTGSSSYNPGLDGLDAVETANQCAKELKARGVNALVLCVHDGASQHNGDTAPINGSKNLGGPALELAKKADPDICAIITGHWHAWFNAMLPDAHGVPRPFVEAGHAGQIINEINLRLDPATGKVVRELTTSTNHPVTHDISPDPHIQRIVDYWTAQGKKRSATVAGHLTGDYTRDKNAHGESTLGDLGADLMLWSARRHRGGAADFGICTAWPRTGSNAFGGSLHYRKGSGTGDADGVILYGEAYANVGYENPILTVSLTGEQIRLALEQQWEEKTGGMAPLSFSANVKAVFDATRPIGRRADPAHFLIDGKPLDPNRTYRVAGLAYTLIGVDGYSALADFTDPFRNGRDHEEFIAYLRAESPIRPARRDRVTVIGGSAHS
ncbi:bifunctional metallophosphatase/5'-nucleotidase [Streptomyces orinoci]|uniref:Bifunctional metallophosphatase/5'-nucleotidase n=1 Tax=Streptomyces orinoci TaxID=67339 RepID=A0ABV3K4Q3_STRON|nr:bifunctional metallophosphatase/5'-nucleotidase [Streptomyces orinoci]